MEYASNLSFAKRNRTHLMRCAVDYSLISSCSLYPPINASAVSLSPSLKPRVKAVTSVILLISEVLSLNFSKVFFCASVSVSVSFFRSE